MSEIPNITRLAIIAGSGDLPFLLRDAAIAREIPVFILGFEQTTAPELMDGVDHAWVSLGDIAHTLQLMKENQVSHIVLGGRIPRPSLRSIRPSVAATRILARLGSAFFSGDNSLLTTVIHVLEEEGLRVIGIDDLLQNLLAPAGPLGRFLPNKQSQTDIAVGVRVAHQLGAMDIGQSVVIKQGIVLGVEAAEGTDELILRCANYSDNAERGGVLVKAKKPNQERRADLPAIGPQTIQNIAAAGFDGVAIEAGGTLVIDRAQVLKLADELGVFIIGFSTAEVQAVA